MSENTIVFDAGCPTITGPNTGLFNGVKFTGPNKKGKFWITATTAGAKEGSTREPNLKEKAALVDSFVTAFSAVPQIDQPSADAFVALVGAANTRAAKPAKPAAAPVVADADAVGQADGADAGGDDVQDVGTTEAASA